MSSPRFFGSCWLPLPSTSTFMFLVLLLFENCDWAGRASPAGSLSWSPRAGRCDLISEPLSLREELLQAGKERLYQDSHILYLKILFYHLSWKMKEVKKKKKKEEMKWRKQRQQTLDKKLQCFHFPKGCFLQRSTSWNCKRFGGMIQKSFVASAGSSPQIPVLFPEMSVVHIWPCVWFMKTVPGLRAAAHRPSPGSWRHSSLMLRLLSAFPGTRSHMDLTITDLNATCWWLIDSGRNKS